MFILLADIFEQPPGFHIPILVIANPMKGVVDGMRFLPEDLT